MHPTPREHQRLGDEIAELSAQLDAATHRFLTLVRRFDACGGFAAQGALTCAHWLSWRVGLDLVAAREHVRVARALGGLPQLDAALRAGELSYSKVRALTRVATPDNEVALLAIARSSTASQLERVCRGFRRATANASDGERPEDERDLRWVRERETESGFVRVDIRVRPEEAAVLRRALEVAASRGWSAARAASAESRPPALRRADALIAVAEAYLAGASADDAGPPVEIVVHVEKACDGAGGTLDDGTVLAGPTVERLACDAVVVQVREGSRGSVLDVGRRRRTIPTLLRRALRLRDRGCRFPGCTNRYVDGHHVVPWVVGGATTLANVCSLCRRHHRFVHELGFHIDADGAGGFAFSDASGRALPAAGAAPALGPTPVEDLGARNRADGIAIGTETNMPRWDGRPADYDHIVTCLLAAGRSPATG